MLDVVEGIPWPTGMATAAIEFLVQYRYPEVHTIVECVGADGSNLMPGFIFSGKEMCPEWGMEDPNIWCVLPFSCRFYF